MFADDEESLIELARSQPNQELRAAAIEQLRRKAIEVPTMMDSEAATEFLLRILEDG